MSELRAKIIASAVIINLAFAPAGLAQASEQQETHAPDPAPNCKGAGCYGLSRAELFIKSFAASGSSKGLRTIQREQEEKVKLAFYGIDATLREIEAGRLTEKEGN